MRAAHIAGVGIMVLALAGCASRPTETPIAPDVVEVQVTKPCVPADVKPPPKAYADDGLTKDADPADRYRLTAAANQQRKARLADIEPVIAGCR